MFPWFVKTIGLGDEFLGNLDHARLLVQRPMVLVLGLALLVPIGLWIDRRQRRNLGHVPATVRVALGLIRVAILAVLVAVIAGPYLRLDLRLEKKPIVAVVLDQSRSMDLPAGPFIDDSQALHAAAALGLPTKLDPEARQKLDAASRATLSRASIERAASKVFTPLAERFDVRAFGFARDLSAINFDPKLGRLPEGSPAGTSHSRVGEAISGVLDETGGRPIAGIVLFTDGRGTGGRSPAEAARLASAASAPIFPVLVGSTARTSDVALADLFAPSRVASGDTAKVSATLLSSGLDGREVTVELVGEAVVDAKPVVLRSDEPQQVELSFKATKPGMHVLTVQVSSPAEEPEALKANNRDVVAIEVSEEKLRVLLVDGLPRWDFRFLKNALRRDKGIGGREADEPDVLLESELRRKPSEGLPRSVDALDDYHAIILGDVSPELLDSSWVDAIAEAVRTKGVGLIVAAGPRFMPHAFDDRFTDLLPIRSSRRAPGTEAPVYNPFRLEPTPEGLGHEATRLYDEPDRNADAWSRMPPYFWCASADRPSPGATVLLTNPSLRGRYGERPLVAIHLAGEGRVLFVGTDSTWLWRRNVGDRYFDQFWGQALRSVVRRDREGPKSSTMAIRPARLPLGEPARVELHAVTADGATRDESSLSVRWDGGGSIETLELTADPARKGFYLGSFTPKIEGEHRVSFEPGGGAPIVEAKALALDSADELRRPDLDLATLRHLAGATGGAVLEPDELATLVDRLKGESTFTEIHREATVWDNGLVLLVVAVLYSIDVGLRRLSGLS